jgi:DNA-binding phage protein
MNITNPLTADISLNTRVGNQIFLTATTVPQSIMNNKWTVNSDNYAPIMSFLNDQKTVNGFDSLLLVPTEGTGSIFQLPTTLSSGQEVANVDFKNKKCIVEFSAQIDTTSVLNYAGFIHGDNSTGLTKSPDMVQKVLNFSVSDTNEKLVAKLKQQLRVRSGMLYILLHKCITKSSLDTFIKSNKATLQYTNEADGVPFYDGLTLLWYILEALEPKSVIDASKYEKTIQTTTLLDCGMNVREYISTVKGAYDELISRHGVNRMTESKYVEHLFNGLDSATNPTFKHVLSVSNTLWLTDSKQFKVDVFLTKLENAYNALITSDRWGDVSETDQKVLAMTTEVNALKKTNTKLLKQLGEHDKKNTQQSGQSNGPPYMKGDVEMAGAPGTVKKGDFIKDPKNSALHHWCSDHRNGKGLYMACNSDDKKSHDHAKWKENLLARTNKKRKERVGGNGEDSSTSASRKRKDSPTKLKVTAGKSRKAAFVTMLTAKGMDHHEAVETWNEAHRTSDEESIASK